MILQNGNDKSWFHFQNSVEYLRVEQLDQIQETLRYLEQRVEQDGLFAAGFVAYEAAAAFDEKLVTHPPTDLPLLYFGLFETAEILPLPQPQTAPSLDWRPAINQRRYRRDIAVIKDHIAHGETYQVNHTFRLTAPFAGDPFALFLNMNAAQQAQYGAFLETDDFAICSASPELFFTLNGTTLQAKPMKGTAPRRLTVAADNAQIEWLRNDEKNRAENVMIVDMVRNDMGRIAEVGSVHVPVLFAVERYPTVLQMTSTVSAETHAPLDKIFAALFPCASITGAPKVRTMQIICERETTPRGAYCGTIGYLMPGRVAQFNVAIRTVTLDKKTETAHYGTGSGVVWDSEAGDEFRETWLKTQVLTTSRPTFELIESLLWEPASGYLLLDPHLDRMCDSAAYFGFSADRFQLRKALTDHAATLKHTSKVRLLLARNSAFHVESAPRTPLAVQPAIGLATTPIDSRNLFLYHKTTIRQMYVDAKATRPDCDEVLLWNERGEITEATSSNVVFELDGEWVTPPVTSGLLAGTMRRHLLERDLVQEQVVHVDDLARVSRIWLINSVRGWREGVLTDRESEFTDDDESAVLQRAILQTAGR